MRLYFTDGSDLTIPDPFGTANVWGEKRGLVTTIKNAQSKSLLTGIENVPVVFSFKQVTDSQLANILNSQSKLVNPVNIRNWVGSDIDRAIYTRGLETVNRKSAGWEFSMSFMQIPDFDLNNYKAMFTI